MAGPSRPPFTNISFRLWEDLAYHQTPWKLSDSLEKRMRIEPGYQYKTCEVTANDPEGSFIQRYFESQKPHGRSIARAFCINNANSLSEFEARVKTIDTEATEAQFQPGWRQEPLSHLREKVIERWRTQVEQFSPLSLSTSRGAVNTYWNVKVLPVWHGSDELVCRSICKTGFAFFGKKFMPGALNDQPEPFHSTDEGSYGSGIYFTTSARYAADEYSPEEGHLMLGWVAMREPFPVVADKPYPDFPSDIATLRGLGGYKNFDAHYIPVTPVMLAENTYNYFPCADGQPPLYDELVVFKPSQTLARFHIILQPDGVPPVVFGTEYCVTEVIKKIDKILTFPELVDRNLGDAKICQEKKTLFKALGQQLLPAEQRGFYSQLVERLQQLKDAEKSRQWIAYKIFDACQNGELRKLEHYLDQHRLLAVEKAFDPYSPIDSVRHQGWTSLHEAAYFGRIPIIRALLNTAPDLIESKHFRKDGYTAFHAAVAGKQLESAKWLYEYKPSLIKSFSADRYTPLRAALDSGDREIIRWLIETDISVLELNTVRNLNPLKDAQANMLLGILEDYLHLVPVLDLRQNQLTQDMALALNACLIANPKVKELQLGRNPLCDEAVAKLKEGLIRATGIEGRLEKLVFKETHLTDKGVHSLAEVIREARCLVHLDLSNCFIGNDGARFLASAIEHNTSLKELHLFSNQITNIGAECFYRALANRLQPLKLNIENNSLNDEIKNRLRRFFPHKILT
jgi:hypothetical protein